jgi:RHS repeat-associated protein
VTAETVSMQAHRTVTVNSQSTYRKGEYFRKELSVANTATNVLQSVSVNANWGTTNDTQNGNIFVPRSPETFTYDADGNLTNDGRWFYFWDAENRLTQMIATNNVVDAARRRLVFEYDYRDRRTRKTSFHPNGSSWVVTNDHRFVYDQWNLVAELNATNNALIRSFAWAAEVDGNLTNAAKRRLVAVNDVSNGLHFTAQTDNDNIGALIKGIDGSIGAAYEYGPFGETIRVTGSTARDNRFRFGTKYSDSETEMMYFGYRYLHTSTGRWLSRDPLFETGFTGRARNRGSHGNDEANEYAYVHNSPVILSDDLGLSASDVKKIEDNFLNTFFEMCDRCMRCDGGFKNNIMWWFDKRIKGCIDQADFMKERLRGDGTYDDMWTFETSDVTQQPGLVTWPHTNGEARSDRSGDPQITFDPHRGQLIIYYPDRTVEITAKCSPRSSFRTETPNMMPPPPAKQHP